MSLISLIFAIYFVFIQAPNTEKNILKQINAYADYLSKASEYSVLTGNFDIISAQIKLICNNPAINTINIYNAKNIKLSTEKSIHQVDGNTLFNFLYAFLQKEQAILSKDINIEPIEVFDYSEDQQANTQNLGRLEFEINNEYLFFKKYISASYGFYITFIIYLFALYSSLRFSRKVVDGIENIDQTLYDIESGNLHARVNKALVDKFGGIGEGIEKMAGAINVSESNLREKIDKATHKLHTYNQEIVQSNKKLIVAREQADKANAAKTNFLANISHEIRTPVNGIIGFTELLLSADIKQEHKLCIQNIDDASNKLIRLINDLLDFSKLESGHINIDISRVDIYELAAKLHSFYSVNSKNKDVDIYFDIDSNTPRYIFTDEHKLEQIITNLFSNAIKFTEAGYVKIEISSNIINKNNCGIKINVSDSGIGIATENQKDIFKMFEQADMTTSRKYGGSGLGLSIASLLAKHLNGSINVKSEPNVGSTFTLSLLTQYESSKLNTNLNGLEINYYDEDSAHHQNLSNLLIQLGCNVNKLSFAEAQRFDGKTLICGFTHETSANNFIQSFNQAENMYENCISFFSFYSQETYRKFRECGFQHNSLRTYRLNSLINILEDKPVHDQSKNYTAENHVTALIVDDNKINVMLLEKYLQKLGVHTIAAFCGSEALNILEEIKPNIILTDLHMPHISGIELAIKIRSQYPDLVDTPIIAITADSACSNHKKAVSNGIQEVLLKPVSFEIIMEKLVKYTNIGFIEEKSANGNMKDIDIQTMLMKQLPIFKHEIHTFAQNNELNKLYQSIHRLVGGLEYCPKQRSLLDKAKTAYLALEKEKHNVSNIQEDITQLLNEIDAEISIN